MHLLVSGVGEQTETDIPELSFTTWAGVADVTFLVFPPIGQRFGVMKTEHRPKPRCTNLRHQHK